MHYFYSEILNLAQPTPAGNKKASITLNAGDTADSVVSNHWDLQGPGTVDYYIDPTGVTITYSPTVARKYLT